MWFGDLVTMKWFNDVWMKEVFANFMAAKIVNPSFPDVNHDLRFLFQHYPAAYDVDRTEGANPIRQDLANLNEAGSLYGAIIYQKAPIVMRQLERIMGAEGLRDGLRDYLKTHSFGNATWSDLVAVLDARTPEDLAAWSRAWVEEPGRPVIKTEVEISDQHIDRLAFTQSDPRGRQIAWPERLQVLADSAAGVRTFDIKVSAGTTEVPRRRRAPDSEVDPSGRRRPRVRLLRSRPGHAGLRDALAARDSRSADSWRGARCAVGVDARGSGAAGAGDGRAPRGAAAGDRRAQRGADARVRARGVLAVHRRRRSRGPGAQGRSGASRPASRPRDVHDPQGGVVRHVAQCRDDAADGRVARAGLAARCEDCRIAAGRNRRRGSRARSRRP